jgi:hypothetical protein
MAENRTFLLCVDTNDSRAVSIRYLNTRQFSQTFQSNLARDSCVYAHLLKTPRVAVRLLSGERSRIKRIEIRGVSKRQIEQLLAQDA